MEAYLLLNTIKKNVTTVIYINLKQENYFYLVKKIQSKFKNILLKFHLIKNFLLLYRIA